MKALVLGLSFSLVASSFVFAMPALVNSLATRSFEEPVLPRPAHTDPRPLVTPSLPPPPSNEAAGLPRIPPNTARRLALGRGHGEERRAGQATKGKANSKRDGKAAGKKGNQPKNPPGSAGEPPSQPGRGKPPSNKAGNGQKKGHSSRAGGGGSGSNGKAASSSASSGGSRSSKWTMKSRASGRKGPKKSRPGNAHRHA